MDPAPKQTEAPDAAMTREELEEIGVRLYGRWGWPVKLGKAIGKDPTTLRRWKQGNPIELAAALAIRDHDRRVSGGPSWEERYVAPDTGAYRALGLIARAQALQAAGGRVAIRVEQLENGLLLTLETAGRGPIAALSDQQGFQGLDEFERALEELSTPSQKSSL